MTEFNCTACALCGNNIAVRYGVSACIVCTLEFLFKTRKTGCLFAVKNSEMTEDEQKVSEKAIQDLTDRYIREIDAITAKKTKDIMSI